MAAASFNPLMAAHQNRCDFGTDAEDMPELPKPYTAREVVGTLRELIGQSKQLPRCL
jgi:hypothetical protein